MGNVTAIINPTIGILTKGNFTSGSVCNNVNTSSPTREVSKKIKFRFMNTPTPYFQGRQQIIELIRDYFAELPPKAADGWSRVVVITGPAGMGKTQLAYTFARDYRETFPNVARISAETKDSTLKSFLGFAKDLGIVPRNYESADAQLVQQIYRYIDQEDYGNVLLLFDDAWHLDSIQEYMPMEDLPNGRFPHIIITTQTREWDRQIKTVHVDALLAEESLDFFRDCFKAEYSKINAPCKKLHELLQGYPLAMNVAASAIGINCSISVDQLQHKINLYINKVEQQDEEILNEKIHHMRNEYRKSLSTAWESTFKRLKEEKNGTQALELLQILSLLKLPRTYHVNSVSVSGKDCPIHADRYFQCELLEFINILHKFHAARILETGEGISTEGDILKLGLYRLFQLVVRRNMNDREATVNFQCCVDVLADE